MKFRIFTLFIFSSLILMSCGSGSKTTSSNKNDYTFDFYSGTHNIKEVVSKEYEKGKTPILYFTANWCMPCREFKKTIKSKEMSEAFENATLIIIDADVDKTKDKLSYLYAVNAIPTFIKVDKNAEPLNTMIGGDWAEPTPYRVAASMSRFIK